MNLSEILHAIDAEIVKLQQARELIDTPASTSSFSVPKRRRGRPPGSGKPSKAKLAGKRAMSAEGKARIVAAQKKRWAASRKLTQSA